VPDTARPRRFRRLRISLRGLFAIMTLWSVALCWWLRPYELTTLQQLFTPAAIGHRVDSYRRQLLDAPLKHGQTTIYDETGKVIFQDHWQNGMRHGPYRHWEQPSGVMTVELQFDRGELVSYRGRAIEDWVKGRADLDWNPRLEGD
jgi:hypothetical protein